MIKINLARKKKGKSSGGDSKVFGIDISGLSGLLKLGKSSGGSSEGAMLGGVDLKKSNLVKVLVGFVIIYVVQSTIDDLKLEAMRLADTQIASVETQISEVQAKLAKVKGFEAVKKQLEDDENVVRTKLDVINKLLQTRVSPSKMLLYLASKIPNEVWLTEFATRGESLRILGSTTGYSEVSDFLNSMSESSFFEDIRLNQIQESSSIIVPPPPGQNGAIPQQLIAPPAAAENRIQNFEITAKRRMVF
ncbi:MAG: PilN domain-containing protein [Bacteriovoracia bacterium]